MAPTSSSAPSSSDLPDEVRRFEPAFLLDKARLQEIVKEFKREMKDGLENYGRDTAMIPSYLPSVPTGLETGTFLALDLGGTNLRVCEVVLKGNHEFQIKQRKFKVSQELKEGEARVLFDYIADSIDAFLTEVGSDLTPGEAFHLGFTFSFPVEQTALNKGKLLTWTKGFAAKNAIGHDVVKLLQDSLDRKHIKVKVAALVNDTVGTLLSRSYQSGPALIGAIFGTGTNGAYIDKVDAIKKLGDDIISEAKKGGKDAGEYMVVNTEWGALDNGRKVLTITPFDNKLDRESINPRKQAFEKMVSGMYLGEITRNILLYLIDQGLLFDGHSSEQLNTHYGLDTALVSAIEQSRPQDDATVLVEPASDTKPIPSKSDDEIKKVLINDLGVKEEHIKPSDIKLVQWATKMVTTRAAYLSACAVVALVEMTGHEGKEIDVGMDGSVAEFLPNFEPRVRHALRELLGDGESKIKLGLAKDGSGVGAALCALQAMKAEKAGAPKPEAKSVVPTSEEK